MNTVLTNCPAEDRAQLDVALAKSEKYQTTFANPFLAQMNRKDTPILSNEVVPSLLTEDVGTVRLVSSTLDAQLRKETYDLAVGIVTEAQKNGYMLAQAEEKLEALKDGM